MDTRESRTITNYFFGVGSSGSENLCLAAETAAGSISYWSPLVDLSRESHHGSLLVAFGVRLVDWVPWWLTGGRGEGQTNRHKNVSDIDSRRQQNVCWLQFGGRKPLPDADTAIGIPPRFLAPPTSLPPEHKRWEEYRTEGLQLTRTPTRITSA